MLVWEDILDRLGKIRILVIGDMVLDQYIWGEVNRISPEAPIPVVQVIRETFSTGGAANVANNVRSLGADVDLCGVIGDDGSGRILLDLLNEKHIKTSAVVMDPDRPTTLKTRVIAHKQQVVRVDRECTDILNDILLTQMEEQIEDLLSHVDAIILEDYGKGVIQNAFLKKIVPMARGAGRVITVDPKQDHFDYYQGVTAITPNRLEAEQAAGLRILDSKSLYEVGNRLVERLQCSAALVTLGEKGMCLFEQGKRPLEIPAHAREVYDVSGAGDTVIAVFTAALVAGATMQQAARLSNLAGGIVVEKLGTATVNREEMRMRLNELP